MNSFIYSEIMLYNIFMKFSWNVEAGRVFNLLSSTIYIFPQISTIDVPRHSFETHYLEGK